MWNILRIALLLLVAQTETAPPGMISGRITDRNGKPVRDAVVTAERPAYVDGRRVFGAGFSQQGNIRRVSGTTNKLGEYRLTGLPPGQYYVSATESGGRSINGNPLGAMDCILLRGVSIGGIPMTIRPMLTTPTVFATPVFYPATLDPQAALPVNLRAGVASSGVDIAILPPVKSARVRGEIIDGRTGKRARNMQVSLIQRMFPSLGSAVCPEDSDNGSFDVFRGPPGSYYLSAVSTGNGPPLSGRIALDIGGTDIKDLKIVVWPGVRVSGRVIVDLDSSGNRPDAPLSVALISDVAALKSPFALAVVPKIAVSAGPRADGAFTLEDIATGDYRVSLPEPGLPGPALSDAYVKSIRLGNLDVLADGLHIDGQPAGELTIEVGINGGAIEGHVVDSEQRRIASATVVLVPAEGLRRRPDLYRVAFPDVSGRFQIRRIAPGEYKLFVWERVEEGAWRDAEFIRLYEDSGTPLNVEEGSRKTVEIKPVPPG